MIQVTLVMTLLVQVVLVKSSYSIITKVEDLEIIKDDIIAAVSTIDSVLPTLASQIEERDYAYVDKHTALLAVKRAIDDTINGEIEVVNFLRYLRRLFIVSGKAYDDVEFHKFLVEMYQLAKYKEVNKDEM